MQTSTCPDSAMWAFGLVDCSTWDSNSGPNGRDSMAADVFAAAVVVVAVAAAVGSYE